MYWNLCSSIVRYSWGRGYADFVLGVGNRNRRKRWKIYALTMRIVEIILKFSFLKLWEYTLVKLAMKIIHIFRNIWIVLYILWHNLLRIRRTGINWHIPFCGILGLCYVFWLWCSEIVRDFDIVSYISENHFIFIKDVVDASFGFMKGGFSAKRELLHLCIFLLVYDVIFIFAKVESPSTYIWNWVLCH